MNKYAIGFKRAVLAGVALDWAFAVPAILVPSAVVAQLGASPARLSVWPAFAALLLVLLELFFITGACDINRYRANAWIAVLMRLVVVVLLFGVYPGELAVVAWTNLLWLPVQAGLLSAALRVGPAVRP